MKKPIKKPIGYSASDRKSMSDLVRRMADPYAGDVTGGSSITVAKKKPIKRMAGGGPLNRFRDGWYAAGYGMRASGETKNKPIGAEWEFPYVASGKGDLPEKVAKVPRFQPPVRGKSGVKTGTKSKPKSGKGASVYASGGIVKAPARSAKDMRAGAGSGVGRIQKTKIARGR